MISIVIAQGHRVGEHAANRPSGLKSSEIAGVRRFWEQVGDVCAQRSGEIRRPAVAS